MIRGVIFIKGGGKALADALPEWMRAALAHALIFWHGEHFPRHFESQAAGRYHYQRRKRSYEIRKQKRFGHSNPLVFTGRLKSETTRTIKVTGTAKQAKGALSGPRYLWAYRKDYGQPDKAVELLKTTHAEDRELAQHMDEELTGAANACPATETARIS